MLQIKNNERAFTSLYVIASLIIIVIIIFVGALVSEHRSNNSTVPETVDSVNSNSSEYSAFENGTIIVGNPFPAVNGSTNNTFTVDSAIFPNAPSNYNLIYTGTTATDSVLVTQDLSSLLSGEEADYLTSESMTNVHKDINSMCTSHKYSFEKTVNNVTYMACSDNQTKWIFSILPAGEILSEPWFKVNSVSETTLANSLWVEALSSQKPDIIE
jgi:hypothetical protein